MRRPRSFKGMLALAIGAAATIAPVPARAATKLTSAYTAISGVFGGQWAAQEAGIFARYGIDSSLVYIASATKTAQAMLAGEVPIAVMGGEAVVSAALGGANLVFVAGVLNRSLYFIVVRQDILSPQDLRGKAIGVTRYGATSDFSARLALRHWRLEPNKDVALLQLGGVPEILAAMKSGAVQGGTMTPPTNVRARHQGYRELVNVGELGFFPHVALVTTRVFLREQPEVVRAYLQAYTEGVRRYKTDKAFGIAMLRKYTKVTDPQLLEESYALAAPPLEDSLYLEPKGLQTVLEFSDHPRAKAAKPEDFMDLRLVHDLERSGFLGSQR